jgi:hypothetical protein
VIEPLKETKRHKVSLDLVSTASLVAIFGIVANVGVIFTSRDWDVAGVISATASSVSNVVRITKE